MGSRAAKAKSVDATAKNDPFYNFTVTEAKFEEYKRRAMKGFWRHAITGFIMISVVEYYLYKNAYPYLVKKTINKDLGTMQMI